MPHRAGPEYDQNQYQRAPQGIMPAMTKASRARPRPDRFAAPIRSSSASRRAWNSVKVAASSGRSWPPSDALVTSVM